MKTDNNNIRNGWKKTTLDQLLIEVGTRNKHGEDLPVLSVTNSRGFVLQSDQFARKIHSVSTKNYKVVSKGEFGYNPARINVGSIASLETPEKGLLSPMYVVFKTVSDLEKDYLNQFIKTQEFNKQVKNNTAGSVRQSLNFSAFKNFTFLLPPKEQQRKIVHILQTVDDKISKTEEIISATEKLRRGLMWQFLVRGIGNTKFKKTKLGEIPEDWQVLRLSKLATITRGGSPRPIENYITEESDGLNWLKIGDIEPGAKYISHTSQRIKKEGLSKTTMVRSGDFILSNSMSFGRPYIMKIDACIHDGWLAFKNIEATLINAEFLYYLLSSDILQRNFSAVAAGSGVKNLKRESVANIEVALPTTEEQQKIVNILSVVDEKIRINKNLKSQLLLLKKGLMQDLLSGKKLTV